MAIYSCSMTWIEIIALLIVSSIFFVGFVGSFLPILPGNLIVWAGIIAHRLTMGETSVSWQTVWLTLTLALIAQALDFILGYYGAKRFGGTWKGGLGAVIGAIAGLFLPPPLFWIIFGPLIGAIIGEYYAQRNLRIAGRAGLGTFIGGLVAYVVKIGFSITMIIWFYLEYPWG